MVAQKGVVILGRLKMDHIRKCFALAVTLSLLAVCSAYSQTSDDVYKTLGDSSLALLCGSIPGKAGVLCQALGVPAISWINKGVSLAVDRYFDEKDQALANQYGLTICYKDGKCIKPK
jgi:hypothetical protein